MGKKTANYVARTVNGGWRVWNRKMKKWWGKVVVAFPGDTLNELNGQKRPEKLVELTKNTKG